MISVLIFSLSLLKPLKEALKKIKSLGKLFFLHWGEFKKLGIKNTFFKIKGLLVKVFILGAIASSGVAIYKSKILPTKIRQQG